MIVAKSKASPLGYFHFHSFRRNLSTVGMQGASPDNAEGVGDAKGYSYHRRCAVGQLFYFH
jgi:hypothetical protein